MASCPITTPGWRQCWSTQRRRKFPRSISSRFCGRTGRRKTIANPSAAKRLCADLHHRYHDQDILLVEDALYANAPHLRQISGYGWKYVLNVKPDSHESLFKQFAGRQARGDFQQLRQTDADGVQHYYAWTNELCLCASAPDVKVNFLLYEQPPRTVLSSGGPGSPICRSRHARSNA